MKRKKLWKRCAFGGIIGLAGLLLLLFYGPFESFRLLWIQSAMYSSRFQWLARMLYSPSYIDKVLGKNIPFPAETTSRKLYPDFGNESLWNEEILFAPIKGNYYRGYLVKIKDPRRLCLVSADNVRGKLLETLVTEQNALGGVNGGGFKNDRQRGIPWGIVIEGGTMIASCREGPEHTIGGMTADYRLVVGRFTLEGIAAQGCQWAFEFGPLLIINGEKTPLVPYAGGLAPRTAIGQTREGHILLVVVDGRQAASIGAAFGDIQTILYENGAVNAIGLDGGSSSSMVFEGKLVNQPSEGEEGRLLPNALVYR